MSHTDLSLPALLLWRATEEPDATAYIFMDPEVTGTGEAETLTWSELHRKSLVLAEELRLHGTPGDRAAILAPQGLDHRLVLRCTAGRFHRRPAVGATVRCA